MFVGIREVQERVSERIEKVPGWYVDGTLKASQVAERERQSAIGNSVVVCVCVWRGGGIREVHEKVSERIEKVPGR